MRKLTSLMLVVCATCMNVALAQPNDDEMKAMMAYMTPGQVHQMMAKSAGTWSGAITMWMKPGAPPMNVTGESKNEMILGGRYLQSKNTGNMMGMPFEGIGVTGYDNAKKMFVSSWIDNMGTGMMYLEGVWDDATKSIKLSGKMVDPITGKDVPVKENIKFVDDNTQIMEMYMDDNGKEFKSMEIKYTKK